MMFVRCPECKQLITVLIRDMDAGRFECPACKFKTKIRVVNKDAVVE